LFVNIYVSECTLTAEVKRTLLLFWSVTGRQRAHASHELHRIPAISLIYQTILTFSKPKHFCSTLVFPVSHMPCVDSSSARMLFSLANDKRTASSSVLEVIICVYVVVIIPMVNK